LSASSENFRVKYFSALKDAKPIIKIAEIAKKDIFLNDTMVEFLFYNAKYFIILISWRWYSFFFSPILNLNRFFLKIKSKILDLFIEQELGD
jgi:hypothetical protein